jgi:hypothetical protein
MRGDVWCMCGLWVVYGGLWWSMRSLWVVYVWSMVIYALSMYVVNVWSMRSLW